MKMNIGWTIVYLLCSEYSGQDCNVSRKFQNFSTTDDTLLSDIRCILMSFYLVYLVISAQWYVTLIWLELHLHVWTCNEILFILIIFLLFDII